VSILKFRRVVVSKIYKNFFFMGHAFSRSISSDSFEAIRLACSCEHCRETRRLAFEDPHGPGYGGGDWPFNTSLYARSANYRLGVHRAFYSNWCSQIWRISARMLMQVLDSVVEQPDIATKRDILRAVSLRFYQPYL